MLSPTRNTTLADLLRLVAAWLAIVIALQGLHAALALAQGPLHRHASAAHAHAHGDAQRHFHAEADASALVQHDAADWDALAFAITAALALMALGGRRLPAPGGRHVQRPALAWAALAVVLLRPERPPRRG